MFAWIWDENVPFALVRLVAGDGMEELYVKDGRKSWHDVWMVINLLF